MDYQPKFPPFKHQQEGSQLLIENEYFALFDEMGTGKSKTLIDAINQIYCNFLQSPQKGNLTEGVVLVCPNQVKSQWANPEWGQIITHTPDGFDINIIRIDSTKPKPKWTIKKSINKQALTWVIVNYEAVRIQRIFSDLEFFMRRFASTMVLDESIYIKNHTALQTKACLRLGKFAKRRYILNGTPLTRGPLDYHMQFNFLHPGIIGIEKPIIFRNRYAVMGGYKVNGHAVQIVGYQNIPELIKKIRPFYRRVEKKDCLDLPDKLYEVIEVEMTQQQDKHYKEMKENLITFVKGKTITASIILTKILRLSQISAGFISDGDEHLNIFDSSPKIDMVMKLVQESQQPVVIFCMYQPEITMLREALSKLEISYGEIHGEIKLDRREHQIQQFQNRQLKAMICQVATGGLGIELFAAGTVIRLTNPHSHAIQMQAEDRIHRNGLQHNVTYIDILSTRHKGGKTIDHAIYKAHSQKKDLIDNVLELGELDGQI